MMAQPDMIAQELQKSIDENIETASREIAKKEHLPQDQLMTLDAHAKTIQHQLSQYMLLAKKHIADGFVFCVESIKEIARTDDSINLETLEHALTESFSRLDTVATIKDMSSKVVDGTSWKELLGLTDDTLQILYKGAKRLFDNGNHPQAEAAFFFLTTVDFKQYAFWLGLGHAAFHLGNHNQAINAYEMADSCCPSSIWPHIYMANCFEAQMDYQESLTALEKAQLELNNSQEKDPHLEVDLRERIANAKKRA